MFNKATSYFVRRQSFWDRRRLKLRESLWLLWFVILCGLPTVQQAAIGNCLSFDPFPFYQNGLAPSEVDVGVRLLMLSWYRR
jgi:hypothetical protein